MGYAAKIASEALLKGNINPDNVQMSDRDMAKALPKLIPGNRHSIRLANSNLKTASKSFYNMKRLSGMVKVAARIQNRARNRINAVKLLSKIEDLVSMKWISAIQARFLLDKFCSTLGISSEDASLKLNLVCTLHMRIVDLYVGRAREASEAVRTPAGATTRHI